MRRFLIALAFLALISNQMKASVILLPMDETHQRNHLKAYGITYWILSQGLEAYWLLNYRGGAFLMPQGPGLYFGGGRDA